jgi:hypothetical protein
MSHRRIVRFRPGLELVEPRQLPSAGPLTAATATRATGPVLASGDSGVQHPPISPGAGYLAFRVTQRPYKMVPPFQHVLVQSNPPVPGQVYTLNFIALKNGTAKTFDASSGFTVRLNNQTRGHAYPILTRDQQWKP